jgi:AraC family transcriptional regulator
MSAAAALNYQGGRLVRRQQKSWSGVTADVAEMRCDGSLRVELRAELAMLSVMLEEVGGHVEIRSRTSHGQSPSSDGPHDLSLIPAHLDAHGHATGLRYARHLVLQFDGPILAGMLGDEINLASAFAPRLMFSDPDVMHLAQLFAEECTSGEANSRLYGDTLSVALLVALSRRPTSRHPSIGHGQLAPWQIRRVTEYFLAHLADDIPLQTVCDLVRLSRSHFSRAFKLSTGLAPHQWLLQARISKTKQLMLETDIPLAQIAIDVGFADQAHFTRTFGRATGQSPRAWQRAHCA